MTQVTEGDTITSFSYDGDGGRVRKTKDEGRGTTDASYYHPDHLGSSSVITDANGNLVERYEYTPYGTTAVQELVSRPSSLIHHKFTGKELDKTGLYYYGARYYDPEIGRFITADPTIQRPYDPQDLNRYAYCRNNPINYIDPTGLGWGNFWKKFGSTILQIVGTVLAPFTGGLSLYLTFAGQVWSGVQAAQAGQFGAWAAGFAISAALGGIIPAGDFANIGMQVGVGALRGAAIGAISGGIASMAGGGSFGEGAAYGAMGGAGGVAVSSFLSSQQFQNWKGGNGFKSDAEVQRINNKIADIQAMLDEGYVEGGVEGQIQTAQKMAAVNSSPEAKEAVINLTKSISSAAPSRHRIIWKQVGMGVAEVAGGISALTVISTLTGTSSGVFTLVSASAAIEALQGVVLGWGQIVGGFAGVEAPGVFEVWQMQIEAIKSTGEAGIFLPN